MFAATLPASLRQSRLFDTLVAGMDDTMKKPIRVDALVAALNQVRARDAS